MATRLSTDDAARRAEFIWLGPENFPWPFFARGRSWILAMVLCPLFTVGVGIALAPLSVVIPGSAGWLIQAFLALVIGVTTGILTTRFVGRWTNPITPLIHHWVVARNELAAPKETAERMTVTAIPAQLWIEHSPAHTAQRSTMPAVPATYLEEE